MTEVRYCRPTESPQCEGHVTIPFQWEIRHMSVVCLVCDPHFCLQEPENRMGILRTSLSLKLQNFAKIVSICIAHSADFFVL